MSKQPPLAERMRPRHLREIIGQTHLTGAGMYIDRMIKSGIPNGMIMYGPPGSGKTSTAKAMAATFNMPFKYVHAAIHGKPDLTKALKDATPETPVLLFVDEAHRFNTVQQEVLLPYSESGAAITVMATTENPSHAIGPGLRSRTKTLQFKKLSKDEIKVGIHKALMDGERGLASYKARLEEDALEKLAVVSNGDMRVAFNALEMAVTSSEPNAEGEIVIILDVIAECTQSASHHDMKGDQYYDLLAALQKSIQSSDTSASLHYAARLLDAGEMDILMRRLVVIAHEDIGMAAPHVGPQAITTWQGMEMIGLEEGRILVGKLVVQMALSPKSNSAYNAINKALEDVRSGLIGEIPKHMRDSSYATAAFLGNGVDYLYPHEYPIPDFGGWVAQQCAPDVLRGKQYYQPIPAGEEKRTAEIFYALRNATLSAQKPKG